MTHADAVLSLSGVRKSYPHPAGEVEVLRGVDARFDRGETVAIIGPSGSGKSTLLSLLAGLDKPSGGAIHFLGREISQLSERDLTVWRAENLGIVFQQFHLMAHLTAAENAALPLDVRGDRSARAAAAQALTDVGLGHRQDHYPHEMSGGECQRVAIARALVVKPRLLLADEPSGNLDTKTGEHVMDLLFDLAKQKQTTLILVTHNELLAARCDRRLALSEGRLV